MKLSELFRRHPNITREAVQVWFETAFEILDMVMAAVSDQIDEKVKTWNLENPHLLYTLGYLAGFLDAAYQRLAGRHEYDEHFIEELFLEAVERYLLNIEGAGEYLQMARSVLPHGGSTIGGMQSYPDFMKAMTDGGNCYVDTFKGKSSARFSLFLRLTGQDI